MRIFVTGAGGLIGGAVARKLRDDGHTVVALARGPEREAALRSEGFETTPGDVADAASLGRAAERADAVIHTAVGLPPRGITDADAAAVDALADALAGSDRPLVLTSGVGVYFRLAAPGVLDEDARLDGAIPAQLPRVRLEERAMRAADRGVRSVVIRPAHAYGHGGCGAFTRIQLDAAQRMGAAGVLADGAGPYATVHLDDLVAAYVAALDGAPAGARYNVIGVTHTLAEVAGAVSHAVGAGGKVVPVTDAQATWGPLGALLAGFPKVAALRATVELGWTPRGPTLLWELVHGSLRRS